ncbi:MAG: ATP-binding protein [Sulfolobales archaeon]|nr:ATP-binding protein [Sulfolobales archaeon]MCX8185704.1 ATP-binding protein [Sulfolobales archaeon]
MNQDSLMVNEPTYTKCSETVLLGNLNEDGFEKVFGLPVNDFLRHTLIVGSTGSGKTTTAAVISSQLIRYGSVIVVDWNDEYLKKIMDLGVHDVAFINDFKIPLRFNDFDELISILNDVLELSDAQTYLLYKFMDSGDYEPTLQDLMDFLEFAQVDSKWMVETKSALLRRLKLIYNSKTKDLYRDISPKEVIELILKDEGKVYILSLKGLRDLKLRRLAVLTFIKLIEEVKKTDNTLRNVFIFIDEAHHIANSSLMSRMAAEVRKLGVGLVLITQSPSAINNEIIANCNVKIVHTVKSNSDIDVLVKSLGVNELRDVLPRLNVGEVVVDSPSLRHVVKVSIDTSLKRK